MTMDLAARCEAELAKWPDQPGKLKVAMEKPQGWLAFLRGKEPEIEVTYHLIPHKWTIPIHVEDCANPSKDHLHCVIPDGEIWGRTSEGVTIYKAWKEATGRECGACGKRHVGPFGVRGMNADGSYRLEPEAGYRTPRVYAPFPVEYWCCDTCASGCMGKPPEEAKHDE